MQNLQLLWKNIHCFFQIPVFYSLDGEKLIRFFRDFLSFVALCFQCTLSTLQWTFLPSISDIYSRLDTQKGRPQKRVESFQNGHKMPEHKNDPGSSKQKASNFALFSYPILHAN